MKYVNWYRGFFRIWLLASLLWTAVTGYAICEQYLAHSRWQPQHEDWKRRYAEWVKTPPIPGNCPDPGHLSAAHPTNDIRRVPDATPVADDLRAKIARGEHINITPELILQTALGPPTAAPAPQPKEEPKLCVVESKPLPPEEPAEPYCDISLRYAFFLLPAGAYASLRSAAWVLRGFQMVES